MYDLKKLPNAHNLLRLIIFIELEITRTWKIAILYIEEIFFSDPQNVDSFFAKGKLNCCDCRMRGVLNEEMIISATAGANYSAEL